MYRPGRVRVAGRGEAEHHGKRRDDPVPRGVRSQPGSCDQQHAAGDPGQRAGLPDQPQQRAQPRRLDSGARKHCGLADHAMGDADEDCDDARGLQKKIAHRNLHLASIQYCMEYRDVLVPVITVGYGDEITRRRAMADQLSAQDWVDLGLKTLAKSGFTALKAEPLARAMGVSRGSFYWHFADIGAFHAAILTRWREVATEQIIAAVEAAKSRGKGEDPLAVLLKLTFGSRLVLEKAVRSWAANDGRARAAVV